MRAERDQKLGLLLRREGAGVGARRRKPGRQRRVGPRRCAMNSPSTRAAPAVE